MLAVLCEHSANLKVSTAYEQIDLDLFTFFEVLDRLIYLVQLAMAATFYRDLQKSRGLSSLLAWTTKICGLQCLTYPHDASRCSVGLPSMTDGLLTLLSWPVKSGPPTKRLYYRL